REILQGLGQERKGLGIGYRVSGIRDSRKGLGCWALGTPGRYRVLGTGYSGRARSLVPDPDHIFIRSTRYPVPSTSSSLVPGPWSPVPGPFPQSSAPDASLITNRADRRATSRARPASSTDRNTSSKSL